VSGIATGSNVETVSWFLLKNYFRFVGPVTTVQHRNNSRLIIRPVEAFKNGDGCNSDLETVIQGVASHIALKTEGCSDEACSLLSSLCEAGYSFGEAVRDVNERLQTEFNEDSRRLRLWLLGDPTLRLHPFRPSEELTYSGVVSNPGVEPQTSLLSNLTVPLRQSKDPV